MPAPPNHGSESISLERTSSKPYSALADRLDETRLRLNEIVTCWKDAVGPEPDSSLGRSNQASKLPSDDDGEDEEEEEEEEEDENSS